MMPKPATAVEAARHLWARSAGDTSDPQRVAAAAERLCGALSAGLGRWIGREGYRALLKRALALTKPEHPALGSLHCLNGDDPVHKIAARPNGADEVAAGIVALVAVVIELLGKIIGDEMAMRLVEQTGKPTPRGAVRAETQGAHDG